MTTAAMEISSRPWPGVVLRLEELGGREHARNAGGHTADAEGDGAHQVDVDAGEPGRFRVVTGGEDVTSEARAEEDEGQRQREAEPDKGR